MSKKFNNKVVWITGASSGIGEATAYRFAQEGARIIVTALEADLLEGVVNRCKELGAPDAAALPFDLSDSDGLDALAEKAWNQFGGIDVLYNNAGISQRGTTVETEMRVIRKVDREMALLKLNDLNNGDERSHLAFSYLEAYIESAKANQDVAAAKNILEEISFLNYDLRWKVRIPQSIKWYDLNFDNVEWGSKEYARLCVDEALELIRKNFTKEEVKEALRRILSARENMEEIREAEGLLG